MPSRPQPPTALAGPLRRALTAGLVALAALVALVAGAGPAAAHASLLSVDPAHGSVLDQSPPQVTLRFSEPVSVELGGVRVLDGDGQRVEAGAAQVDGPTVTIGLQPDLPDGTYVVSYRIVSADGHPVRGASIFGVGDVELDTDAAGRVADDDDRVWEVVGGVARGLSYAGVLVAAGGAAFLVHAHRGGPERPALVRLVRLAAAVGWVTALVALPVQAALGTGQGPMSLFDDGVLGKVAAEGLGLSIGLVTVGLALVVVGTDRSGPAALVGGTLAAGSFAAWGHNRAGDQVLVATVADVAHLLAAAVWAGGIVLLWRTLRLRRAAGDVAPDDAAETGRIVARFSVLATGGIVAVGLAGLALSWTQLEALSDLTDGTYGLFLLAKVALVVAIAALGAYNHFRLVPALGQGKARAALARLWTTLRVEAVVLVGVLALTSVLVVTTPPATGGMQLVERIVEVGEDQGSIQVVVDPARAGFNQLHLYTYGPDGAPAEIGEALTVELTLPSAGLGPFEVVPQRAGPAHFQLDSSDFALAGEWQLLIRVRVDRFTEAAAETTVPIAP